MKMSAKRARSDLNQAILEQVNSCLLKVDIEGACDILHNYFSEQTDRVKKEARDQLLHTEEVEEFFNANGGRWDAKFIECLKRLANYCATLLKPPQMRPEGVWETIMRGNHIFEEYVRSFESHELVLEAIGYKLMGESYIFQKRTHNFEKTKCVCSDLLVLQAFVEVSLRIKRERPAQLPVRSEVKRSEPLKTPDAESTCEICSKPAKYLCSSSECEGKAWCTKCNNKWHVKNARRQGHPFKEIPNSKEDSLAISAKPSSQAQPPAATPTPAATPAPTATPAHAATPPLVPRRRSVQAAGRQPSSPTPPARTAPVPTPRRRTSTNQPSETPVKQQTNVPVYQKEIKNLEKLVNSMLPSTNIALFLQRINAITKAMEALQVKIGEEPASSGRKVQYNTELIAMSKQRDRLDERLSELEREKKIQQAAAQLLEETNNVEEEMEVDEDLGFEADAIGAKPVMDPSAPTPLTYLRSVAEAENSGFSMDEILLGLNNSPFNALMDWLTLFYPIIQSEVLEAAENTPYIPKLTKAEIREAVITYGKDHEIPTSNINTHPILTICLNNRKKLIEELFAMFAIQEDDDNFFKTVDVITRNVIEDCLKMADGDLVETKRLLNERVAEKVRQHIWAPIEPDELVPLDDKLSPVLKSALDVMTSDEDRNVKLMIAMAEFKLSHAAADELLFLLKEFYQKDDRQFEVKDAVIALSEKGIPGHRLHASAVIYLSNECSACFDKFPSHEMANLCCHDSSAKDMGCCKGCARGHFESLITTEPVTRFACPSHCGAPGADINADLTKTGEFFESLLSVVFPNIGLSIELITKFNNKLAFWRLSFEPNFHWCPNGNCSKDGYGFVDEQRRPRIACPQCGISIKCRFCDKPWKDEHENMTCEEFATWERENSEEYVEGVQKRDEFLHLYGIKCPKCKKQFQLSRGGCMDCKCPECNYQFCNGCGTCLYPRDCPQNDRFQCDRLGLHGHHPRNCHSYLRDFSTDQLKQLLQENDVECDSGVNGEKCQQMLEDDHNAKFICGEDEVENSMCRRHYTEYLTAKVNANKLEVLSMMEINQLIMVLKRDGKEPPEQGDSSDDDYRELLIPHIKEVTPLEDLSAFQIY